METNPDTNPDTPPLTNPDAILLRDVHRVAVDNLRQALPKLPDNTSDEAWRRRDRVALAEVAALVPVNPAEAKFAALAIAAADHALACFAELGHAADLQTAGRIRAQAASMGRESRGYLAKLLGLQRERRKREGIGDTGASAAQAEHIALSGMTEALENTPPGPPERAPPRPLAPAPVPKQAAAAPEYPKIIPWNDRPEEEKHRDRIRGRTDEFAIINIMEAQYLRKLGHVPPNWPYELPDDPEVLEFLLHGTSGNLRWVDTYVPHPESTGEVNWVPPPGCEPLERLQARE